MQFRQRLSGLWPDKQDKELRLRRVVEALHAADTDAADTDAADMLADAERSWVERIEAIRQRTEASTETVPDRPKEPRGVGEIAKQASKKPAPALMLFKLVRAWRPTYGVELGTCVGVSTAYQGAALALNERGRLVTLEQYSKLADVARRNLESLGLDNVEVVEGKFRDTLGSVLARGPVDYAFVDGHHQENPTVRYFNMLLEAAEADALYVFDDIAWSAGMERAWERITGHAAVDWSTRHGGLGICRVRV